MNAMWSSPHCTAKSYAPAQRRARARGGGNNDLLIHTGRTAQYIRAKNLEETLFHEAVHTSIDGRYADSPEWKAAQAADSDFISSYARDNPDREDMAELSLSLSGHLFQKL